jgi:hypothetical protein|tara:strand:+ start:382 stop:894 length:513 start_codon:yes stop_codon:yes gene_type:complete
MKGCAIGDNSVFDIDVEGCQPVSEDKCKSGFQVLSKDINTPKNSLDQCCKCKSGKPCNYCLDSGNCSEDEKTKYVSQLPTCYANLTDDASTSASPSGVDSDDVDNLQEKRDEFENNTYETLKDSDETTKSYKKEQKAIEEEEGGSSFMLILSVILLLIVLGGGFYFYTQK